MEYLLVSLTARLADLAARLRAREDDGSQITETVLIIAFVAALAIGVGVVITSLVLDKAHSIHL
ncbi:hypothetical protein [Catenulispora pinisilvae]|uniref:hypothetical protein n=1 Tax=Catenulispora pinisilvae TaxID=2705253 RepID=UPI001891ED5E|nr:hypothetical protein [Catenulispora pinisilvae]